MLGRIAYLITLFWLVLIVKGYPYMLIYRKLNDGPESLTVASKLEIEQGTNLSLICKVLRGDKYRNGEVVWDKHKNRLIFSSLENAQENGVLTFINVKLQHQGVYYCLNNFLYKKINLKVKMGDGKRVKRDDYYEPPISVQEALDKMQDYLEKSRKEMNERNSNYHDSYIKNSYDNNGGSSSYDYNKKYDYSDNSYNSYNDDKRNDYADDRFKSNDILPKFLYMMFGGLAIFVLVYIITKCCHENDGEETRNQRSRSERRPCSHAVCLHYREQDPTVGCVLGIRFSSAALRDSSTGLTNGVTTTVTSTDFIEGTDIPLTYITDDDDIPSAPHLDLPPTYEHSAGNSRTNSTLDLRDAAGDRGSARNATSNDVCDLPPTYEEAISNVVDTCASNADTSCASDNATCDTGDRGGGSND